MTLTKDNLAEKASKTWKNYGDVSSREHGGRFLKFEEGEYSTPDHWTLVTTNDMEGHGMMEDSEDRYMFEEWVIEPDMVWVDGEPSKGFTDSMQDAADALQDDIDPQDIEQVEWVIPDLAFHIRAQGYDSYASNYWKHLKENWGIRPRHE